MIDGKGLSLLSLVLNLVQNLVRNGDCNRKERASKKRTSLLLYEQAESWEMNDTGDEP